MPELPHDVLHIIFNLLVPGHGVDWRYIRGPRFAEWPDMKTQVTYLDEELEIKKHPLPPLALCAGVTVMGVRSASSPVSYCCLSILP